jgi:hypothetical protein
LLGSKPSQTKRGGADPSASPESRSRLPSASDRQHDAAEEERTCALLMLVRQSIVGVWLANMTCTVVVRSESGGSACGS